MGDVGFLLVSLVYRFHPDQAVEAYGVRSNLVLLLCATWAVRLSAYITWRNYGHGEGWLVGWLVG
jgi:steroid 5-alpha reductase family enzyme